MPTWSQRQARQPLSVARRAFVARPGFEGRVFAVITVILLAAATAAAQDQPPARVDALGSEPKPSQSWRWGAFVGAAHKSPINPRLGQTPGRDHLFLGLQAQTTVLKIGGARLSYGIQAVPLVIIRGRSRPLDYFGEVDDEGLIPGPEKTYAYGFSPFALELAVPFGSRLAGYFAAAGGLMFFPRPYPVPEGKRANFTIEYGSGLLLRVGDGTWLQAGYKYHHLSNAYRERVNPGIDGHVIYAGFWKSVGR